MINDKHTAVRGMHKSPCAPIDQPDGNQGAALFADSALAALRFSKITPRESEVLDRMAAGQPTKVIAADLGIGIKTVEFYRAQLMSKTGCRSLFELGALWGVASGVRGGRAPKLPAHPYAPLEGGVALRTALATVSAASGDPSRSLPKLDRLTIEQLRQRAVDDRKDAHAAVQCRDIVTAAMLLADADRCEVRAERLEDHRVLQK